MRFFKSYAAILCLCVGQPLFGGSEIVKEFQVEPLTSYRLTFYAKSETGAKSDWELRFFSKDGRLPHEGVHKNDWQVIRPEKETYRHDILSPKNAGILKLVLNSEGPNPVLADVTLEKI